MAYSVADRPETHLSLDISPPTPPAGYVEQVWSESPTLSQTQESHGIVGDTTASITGQLETRPSGPVISNSKSTSVSSSFQPDILPPTPPVGYIEQVWSESPTPSQTQESGGISQTQESGGISQTQESG
eukprot:988374_1